MTAAITFSRPGIHLAAILYCSANLGMLPVSAEGQTLAAAAASDQNTLHEEYIMTASQDDRPTRSSSRIAAPEIAPVIHAGNRYEPLKSPASEGLPPGGYLVVSDVASGNRVNVIKIYETAVDPNKESDVQAVFFKSMRLSEQGDALLIEDEKKRRYNVDLKTGEVKALPGAEPESFLQKLLSGFGIGK